jgi:tricorn protease
MLTKLSTMCRIAFLLAFVGPAPALAVDTQDTSFLHEPAITADRIVFVYADDLWTAKPDGADARRLTAHPGPESDPYISPDGTLIAFTGTYDGNRDVYIMPINGGEPKRLTWHPGPDEVCGFSPSGNVLFRSPRSVFTNRYTQFFTLGPTGGFPEALKIPCGFRGAYSPDGKSLAYVPLGERFRQWKNYRGGTTSRIWILKLSDLSVEQIPQPEGRCNDTYPMWIGDTVYFLSDRDGEFNLYSYNRESKAIKRLTQHEDFPIEAASAGAGKVIYEQAGHLWTYTPGASEPTRLKIGVAADLVETRPRHVKGDKYIRDADISPSGKRAVFEARGEIVTVPAKTGDVRNLTRTPGVHERSPVWSPDGKSIAYFSDASGEYALHIVPQDGKGQPKTFLLQGAGFYERPVWSSDSKKIAFIDNSRTLYWINLDSGKVMKIASEPIYGPVNTMRHVWSPDSKWLAYTLTNKALFQTLRLYSLDQGESTALTDGLAEVAEPAFDASGKYLYFLVSTDAGPVKQWFDQSNADMQATYSIFLAVLAKATPNPLLKENDEEGESLDEKAKDEKKDDQAKRKDGEEGKDKDKVKDEGQKPTVVDLDGITSRILALPIPAGNLSNLAAGEEGKIYYIRRVGMVPGKNGEAFAGTPLLARFDLKTREEETLAEKVDEFRLSADHKKLLYRSKETWGIVDVGKFTPGKEKLAVEDISLYVEPRAEWAQMFHEAWWINRDYFYDPNMHGADWSAMLQKYEPLVAEVPTREDLNRVIRGLLSELAVGHSYLGGGDHLYEPKEVPVGLLGADYEVADGRYRIKKIYGGLNWDPELKAPLVAPGVDVKEGEYLLAVDGEDLKSDQDIYSKFEDKVGRRVELKVGPKPDGADARTVVVEPIKNEFSLRNRDWVEANLRKVHERTNGRVAYVYVPNTADLGHAYFKRYFFPQVDKEAIIVDERFNGGGQVADYYIDFLRRPVVSYWAMRHGAPFRTPGAAILGPKVMIIDETAGSGGDLLPWMFRRFKLGTLVGRRTWGGLVGILGFPVLMDGGRVTAPDLAFYTEDGWRVENEGVPPDIEVEQWPAEVAAGKDPQLDRAIEVALDELKRHPPKNLEPPPRPVRVRRKAVVASP